MDQLAIPSGDPERWLPVPDWEDLYEVSSHGRIRNLRTGRTLKLDTAEDYVKIALSRRSRKKTLKVHVLVAGAFIGPRPAGMEVRHGPGGVRDNHVANLSYGTKLENEADKERDGTRLRGADVIGVRLTEEIVRECRARVAAGESPAALARVFDVSKEAMARAVAGATWKHVPGAVTSRPERQAELTSEVIRGYRERGEIAAPPAGCRWRGGPKGASGFRGIYWSGGKRKWIARIKVGPRRIQLGTFTDPAEAARAYNAAALEAWGESARLNPIPDATEPPAA